MTMRSRPFLRLYFYPRPPRGGRLGITVEELMGTKFLSTPSARRATDAGELIPFFVDISIHALREEGDYVTKKMYEIDGKFLSTPSARRATASFI